MDILEIMKIPYYKNGSGIHIKEKNRGKFTKSAKEHGMGVLEFANHVLSNKDKYSTTLVKRANFARNAKKFKHAKGGLIKKYQEGNLIIPQIDENSINKDYVQSYFMTKDKNYFIKDWLNNRKNILEKNISNNINVDTELSKLLNNLNNVEEYSYIKDLDFLPFYSKSPGLTASAYEYYIYDFGFPRNLNTDKYEVMGENVGNHVNGLYDPRNNEIGYTSYNPSTIIHERTHSLKADPQKEYIKLLRIKTKNDYSKYDNDYYDDPSEIYSRLMQFRYVNKLNPNKTYTIEDVKNFKENPDFLDFELLDRYSEEDVLKLLNEIAYNNTNESIKIAKKGGSLITKHKSGKQITETPRDNTNYERKTPFVKKKNNYSSYEEIVDAKVNKELEEKKPLLKKHTRPAPAWPVGGKRKA